MEDKILEDLWLSRNPEYLDFKDYISNLHENIPGCFYGYINSFIYDYKIEDGIVYLGILPMKYRDKKYNYYLSKILNVDIKNISPLLFKPINFTK